MKSHVLTLYIPNFTFCLHSVSMLRGLEPRRCYGGSVKLEVREERFKDHLKRDYCLCVVAQT